VSIVSDLQRLGWRYNAEGVLVQPPWLKRVPLQRLVDGHGKRYRIKRGGHRIYVRGYDNQILFSRWTEDRF